MRTRNAPRSVRPEQRSGSKGAKVKSLVRQAHHERARNSRMDKKCPSPFALSSEAVEGRESEIPGSTGSPRTETRSPRTETGAPRTGKKFTNGQEMPLSVRPEQRSGSKGAKVGKRGSTGSPRTETGSPRTETGSPRTDKKFTNGQEMPLSVRPEQRSGSKGAKGKALVRQAHHERARNAPPRSP